MTLFEFVDNGNNGDDVLTAETMFKKAVLEEIQNQGSSVIRVELLRQLWSHDWIKKLSDFALTDNGLSLVVKRASGVDQRRVMMASLKNEDYIVIGRAPGTAEQGAAL